MSDLNEIYLCDPRGKLNPWNNNRELNLDLQGHQPLLWEGEGMNVGCVSTWVCPMKMYSHVDVGCIPVDAGFICR